MVSLSPRIIKLSISQEGNWGAKHLVACGSSSASEMNWVCASTVSLLENCPCWRCTGSGSGRRAQSS
uniref:Uncharacterized protein n=1 Tax=Arundo donax TaxID=35708 RepID=A0A0A9AXX7_ARUDO